MTLESIERNRERIANLSTKYPWLADVEREVAELERNHEFLQRAYDAAIADRDANWMELPVDADGERWKGDERYYITPNGDVRELNSLSYAIRCGGLWFCEDDVAEENNDLWPANECRHYRKPTVEDVMREFTAELLREELLYGDKHREEVTVKYADKLREAAMSE